MLRAQPAQTEPATQLRDLLIASEHQALIFYKGGEPRCAWGTTGIARARGGGRRGAILDEFMMALA